MTTPNTETPQAEPAADPYPAAAAPYAQVAPAAQPKNPAVAVLVAFGAALVGSLAYGFIVKAIDRQIGWLAVGLAAAVAVALAKLGGKHPALPVVGAVFSALSLFLGQIFAVALIAHEAVGIDLTTLLGSELDKTVQLWKDVLDIKDVLFYGIAVVEGFVLTKRFAA